jgi:thioredoxin 1
LARVASSNTIGGAREGFGMTMTQETSTLAASSGGGREPDQANPGEVPLHLADAEVAPFLRASRGMTLLEIGADWCIPCRLMRPIMQKTAIEFVGDLVVAEVNADEAPFTTQNYGVDSFPQLLFFKDDELIKRERGFRDYASLRQSILEFLGRTESAELPESERNFRDDCERLLASWNKPLAATSEALGPYVEAANPLIEAAYARMKADLEAGRITKDELARQYKAEIARRYAPFQDKLDAHRAAQKAAVDAYDAAMVDVVSRFRSAYQSKAARPSSPRKLCLPGDPMCSV